MILNSKKLAYVFSPRNGIEIIKLLINSTNFVFAYKEKL